VSVLDIDRQVGTLIATPMRMLPEPAVLLRLRIAYFLAIPFAIGGFFGWARFGPLAAAMPRELAVIYGGLTSVLVWQLRWLFASGLLRVPIVSRMPLPLLLAVAAAFAELLARPIHRALGFVLAPMFDAPTPKTGNWIPMSALELGAMLVACSPLILSWMGVTIFYERWLGIRVLPRCRTVAAPTPAPVPGAAPEPVDEPVPDLAPEPSSGRLMSRLPPRFGEIRVLRALDHYVEVHGDEGTIRLLYRFEDAARELTGAGMLRVHRSFCIDPASAIALGSEGRRRFVRLSDGLRVPVSATHLKTLLARRPDLRSRRPAG